MNKLIQKVPLFNIPDEPITGISQDFIPMADVTDGMVLHKDGGAAMILETTSLNFGLLSEREQEAVVAAYAALINSLSFPIQILIRTQRKDVTRYIRYLEEAEEKIDNPKLKALMEGYKQFVLETTKRRNVLGKRFFLVIPFYSHELGITQSFKSLTQKSKTLPFTEDYIIKKAKVSLTPKRDHLIRQGARLGLRVRQLDNDQITELLYDVYNPDIDTVREKEEDQEEAEKKGRRR
ncbi:hypothetical protein A2801_01685 [Candidatus Woesebacteria bacterium RIFCSPHIGHO2_01_FULL_41_10]|uniref:TraC-like domain-containing protein n=1 Tax=Candidatus Woesebacteria bacterium RIFCSPHIGHO2_01_FULL_41_10 TaxID=1802500 RepID=A0A1F7YPN6_9BACT|nr:MAG: hypothetical protein A2801_01685 [Candidatus Woesebacteria bacterium RIFCSPHIGHO2_01_FULL_41_10]